MRVNVAPPSRRLSRGVSPTHAGEPTSARAKLPLRQAQRRLSRHLAGAPQKKTDMKIEAITLREIHIPLVHFFETSFSRVYSRRILLVTVHAEGIDGWGECVAAEDPFYSSEWIESARPR